MPKPAVQLEPTESLVNGADASHAFHDVGGPIASLQLEIAQRLHATHPLVPGVPVRGTDEVLIESLSRVAGPVALIVAVSFLVRFLIL